MGKAKEREGIDSLITNKIETSPNAKWRGNNVGQSTTSDLNVDTCRVQRIDTSRIFDGSGRNKQVGKDCEKEKAKTANVAQ